MVSSDNGIETPANLKDLARGENKEQLHFYFAYEEAVAIRAKAIKKLLGKIWKPWNAEIIDIDIVPNHDSTFHISLKYANGKQITLFEFLGVQGIGLPFFDEE